AAYGHRAFQEFDRRLAEVVVAVAGDHMLASRSALFDIDQGGSQRAPMQRGATTASLSSIFLVWWKRRLSSSGHEAGTGGIFAPAARAHSTAGSGSMDLRPSHVHRSMAK